MEELKVASINIPKPTYELRIGELSFQMTRKKPNKFQALMLKKVFGITIIEYEKEPLVVPYYEGE